MSSFLTQCPHCLTSFRVTDRQLDAAEGLVRCGACLGIFSAAANRITVKPTPDEAAAADARELAEFDDDEDIDALDADGSDETGIVGESAAPTGLDEHDAFDEPGGDDESGEPDESDEPDDDDKTDEPGGHDEFDEPPPHHEMDAGAIQRPRHAGPIDSDDADLLEPGDFDVPLGDLNLDIDEDEAFADDAAGAGDEEEEYEDEEDEYDDESGEPDEDEDAPDGYDDDEDEPIDVTGDAAADARLIDIVYEEYVDEDDADTGKTGDAEPEPSEEFEPEFSFDDDDPDEPPVVAGAVAAGTAPDDEYDDEERDEDALVDVPPPTPPRTFGTRAAADKAALHSYLADIEDDDALDPLDDDALDAFDEPVLLDTAPRRSGLVTVALVLANLAFVALLAWQYADANIERLSRSASFAPLLPYACRVLDCPAPTRAQPDQFVSEQLLVRSHPRYAQALEVNLVFRNDAAQAQPFPALELGFHDTSNRMVANRLFQPAEYLPPELQTSEMPAQSSFQVTLELVDPGSDAVNYTLGFRAP